MFDMRVEDVIVALVENMLPVGSAHGLYVRLRLEVSSNPRDDDDERKRVQAYAHFLFDRRTNYTKVFFASGDYNLPAMDKFVMTCDHDSCWRSDGLNKLVEMFFSMGDEVRGKDEKYSELQQFNRIDAVNKIEIESVRDKKDPYGYQRVITVLKVIK